MLSLKFPHVKKHPLLYLFVLGLILRFSLLLLDFSFDMNSFMTWGKDAFTLGFQGFYERASSAVFANRFPNYPPLAIYLFYVSYAFYVFVKNIIWSLNVSFPFFPSKLVFFFDQRSVMAVFFKLPAVFADLGIAIVMCLIVQKIFPKKKHLPLAASLILFNPAFFYNSAYWGQTESISILFLLLSFYVLIFSERIFLPPIFLTLALLSKQSVIVFVPIFLVLYILKFKKNIFKGVTFSLIVFWIAFLPFYKSGGILLFPFITYVKSTLGASGLPFISNHAFNFWALISQWKNIPDPLHFFGLQYRYWGYFLTAIAIFLVLKRLVKRKVSPTNLLLAVGLTAFAAFLFLTKIHERHFEQVLPFFIPVSLHDKKVMKSFIVLSLVHFLNLYHNWPVPKIELLISFVRHPLMVNFFILTFLGIFFYLLRYSSTLKKE